MPTTVRSYSKINLGLAIGPLREDGFHALTTVYHTLEAHDVVTVAAERLAPDAKSRISITCSDPRVPLDERNTVWKMLEAALDSGLPLADLGGQDDPARWAVSVHIDKRLPVQGGLGAGSANAAAALLALAREVDYAPDGQHRLRLAEQVGSDVPLFLLGGAVLGQGRGEQVTPLPELVPPASAIEVVLALPELSVSTPQAFRDWDAHLAAQTHSELTRASASVRLAELSRALASAFCEPHYSSGVFPDMARKDLARHPLSALVRTGMENDFEQVVFRQHPLLGTIKEVLLGRSQPGPAPFSVPREPLYAALSGSGAALFGLYPDPESAEAAELRLQSVGVRSMRTRLLGRAAYWQQMFVGE